MPFSDILEKVYYPIYEKHFSTDEIKEVILFFQTPVGIKYTTLRTSIGKESVMLVESLYKNKIFEIAQRVVTEEISRVTPELNLIFGIEQE